MPFNFSFSTSATVAGSASVNGNNATKGWAYRREAYSNEQGSGVRTMKQKLGEEPVTQTKMYDAEGRPLLIERNGGEGRSTTGPNTKILSIEDITEEEDTEQKKSSTSCTAKS